MGRPPQPHYETATYGELSRTATPARLRFVPHGFAEFVELQRELADEELQLRPPGGEDDFTETLFELAAAVAHTLARHQDHYASEAFFASAATTLSLQRHGRRLGYRSDPGLSATGVVALTVRDGQSGEVAAGLAIKSTASGEDKPQDYETLEARKVDARWNSILPRATTQPINYFEGNPNQGNSNLWLVGVGLGLEVGEPIAVVGSKTWMGCHPYRVFAVFEHAQLGVTIVVLDGVLPSEFDATSWTVWAKPKFVRRLFGWDANSERFPAEALQSTSSFDTLDPSTYPDFAWALDYPGSTYEGSDSDVFLALPAEHMLAGPVVALSSTQLTGCAAQPEQQRDVSVLFRAQHLDVVQVPVVDDTDPQNPIIDLVGHPYPVIHSIAATTTAIRLVDKDGGLIERSSLDPRTQLLTDFEQTLDIVAEKSNEQSITVGDMLELDDRYALEPGMLIVLLRPSDGDATVAKIERVDEVDGHTRIRFALTGLSTSGASEWVLGDLQILANVVGVSHGKSRTEILGGSDGVTPHQRFTLSKPLVTQLIAGEGVDGAAPALVVRVADVAWTRVDDFGDSGPDDRHYRVELDDEQIMSIIFGDGRKGAVPSKGKRHIVAEYRVGLGVVGNVEAGRASKLASADPLIEAVNNPVEIAGGTEPADDDALRREATRYIQTFDRAVSAADHAALALLFPGVARANARYSLAEGVVLVAADADGDPLTDASALAAFLQARRDQNIKLTLRDPGAVAVYLEINFEIDPAYQRQLVEDAVRAALLEHFSFAAREFGQAAHLSQVYASLADITGVDRVRVSHFGLGPSSPSELNDVLIVDVHQWLSLEPANLSLSTTIMETA